MERPNADQSGLPGSDAAWMWASEPKEDPFRQRPDEAGDPTTTMGHVTRAGEPDWAWGQPDRTPESDQTPGVTDLTPPAPPAARLVLGMAVLAAERLRGLAVNRRVSAEQAGTESQVTDQPGGNQTPGSSDSSNQAMANQALAVGVGLAQQSAAELLGLARRVIGPSTAAASRTADQASHTVERAARRSGLLANSGPLRRSRDRLGRLMDNARERGQATVAAGRAEAAAFIRSGVNDGIAWVRAEAVPPIVDGLMPHVVDTVVPRVLEGAMPQIRSELVSAIISELAQDPQLRDLAGEQGRQVGGNDTLGGREPSSDA